MTKDIAAFVRARLTEDETAAYRAAEAAALADTQWHAREFAYQGISLHSGKKISPIGPLGVTPECAHITRHDPARVLREVTAKRRILDEIVDEATGLDMSVDNDRRVGPRDTAAEPYLGDQLLRLLAVAWSDHPDYQPQWRP